MLSLISSVESWPDSQSFSSSCISGVSEPGFAMLVMSLVIVFGSFPIIRWYWGSPFFSEYIPRAKSISERPELSRLSNILRFVLSVSLIVRIRR